MCYYQAPVKGELYRHVKRVHQKSENITCTECNKSMQKNSLTTHLKLLHSKKEQSQYYCKVCTFQSIRKGTLKRHVKNVHQKSSK